MLGFATTTIVSIAIIINIIIISNVLSCVDYKVGDVVHR